MASPTRTIAEAETPATTATATAHAKNRLLLLSTNMGISGGAEEQVIRLAYGFQERGWEPLIVSMLPPKRMPADFEGRAIRLLDLGMRPGLPDPRALGRLARIVADFRPDVVHSHMVHANLMARIVRLIRPYPALVCTHHNFTMAGVKRDHTGVFEVAHRVTDRLAEHSTAVAQSAVDYYVRRKAAPASKISAVPNGVDVALYEHDPSARARLRRELGLEGRFAWLAVGRLEEAKAYPTMIRAFASLGTDQNRTLLICGQGSRKDDLTALACDLGVADRVRFLGVREDIPAVMSAADAFALSSDLEGLPLVLLQASAAGLPIVATSVGGNGEVVVDGRNGRLVPPDDPAVFAKALAEIEALPDEARLATGRAGLERTRDIYDAGRLIGRWEEIYTRLIRQAKGPRRLARVSNVLKDDHAA